MPWGAVFRRLSLAVALIFSAALLTSAADGRFNPPRGQALRYSYFQTRDDGHIVREFIIERRVVFEQTAGGITAEVTQTRTADRAGPEVGESFQAGLAVFMWRPIKYRLDASGAIVMIDNAAALWELFCNGMEAMVQGNDARAKARRALLDQYINTMRSLPEARKLKMLGSYLSPIIATSIPPLTTGAGRDITLPFNNALGEASQLSGKERVVALSAGMILVETTAQGDAAATPKTPAAHFSVARRQQIDTTTGLIVELHEVRTTQIGEGENKARQISTVVSTLAPVS